MATIRWIGRAQAIAQVNTVTIADTWAQGDTITVTINDKDLVVTIGTLTSTSQVATTLQQAWENSTLTDTSASFTPEDGAQDIAEHSEFTATVSSAVVTLTHDSPGVPATVTVTETTTGDGTATGAVGTTATGPNFWDNVDNWDSGTEPGAADVVHFDNSAVSLLYNLDQPSGTLTSITIHQNYTGSIGLPQLNVGGYVEYRPQYLEVDVSTVVVGRGGGSGAGRIKLNTGTVQTAVTVENTGTPLEFGLEAFLWKGVNTANVVNVINGSVGIAALGGEAATLTTLRITEGDVRVGDTVTFNSGTLLNQSGSVSLYSSCATITNYEGLIVIWGTAAVSTSLTLNGGVCDYRSSGTVASLVVGGSQPNATFNCENSNVARTLTATTLNAGGSINDPARTITYTADPTLGSDVRSVSAS